MNLISAILGIGKLEKRAVVVEREGSDKPVCVAESLTRLYA